MPLLNETPETNLPPRWSRIEFRHLAWLIALSLGLRLAMLAAIFGHYRETWEHYVGASDGGSFLKFAQVIYGHAAPNTLTFYDSRIFPGWPVAYGWLLWATPAPVASLGVMLASAAAVPCLYYTLTRSFVGALVLVTLPPAWLLATVHPIAEAFYLALGLAAILAWRKNHLALAGFAVGWMCATKPYGALLAAALALGIALEAGSGRVFRRLANFFWPVAVVGAAGVALNLRLYGDALHQLHVYASSLSQLNLAGAQTEAFHQSSGHWGWPFVALLQTPWQVQVAAWKLLYIYGNLAALLALLARAVWRMRATRSRAPLEWTLAGWLTLNTIAIICGGPYWGFHSFDRYAVWAFPAVVALNDDLWPRYPRLTGVAMAASVAVTCYTLRNHFG